MASWDGESDVGGGLGSGDGEMREGAISLGLRLMGEVRVPVSEFRDGTSGDLFIST